jgi:hypothetical protein
VPRTIRILQYKVPSILCRPSLIFVCGGTVDSLPAFPYYSSRPSTPGPPARNNQLRSWALLPCVAVASPAPEPSPSFEIAATRPESKGNAQRVDQRRIAAQIYVALGLLLRGCLPLYSKAAPTLTLHMTNEGVVSRDLFFALPYLTLPSTLQQFNYLPSSPFAPLTLPRCSTPPDLLRQPFSCK